MKKLITIFLLLCPLLMLAQTTKQIKGQILDRTDGSPIIGATVFIDPSETSAKNYNPQGTVAGVDGRFVFTLPATVKYVVVSSLGYETMKIDLTTTKELVIRLAPQSTMVDEVVVTGYQKIEKRKLTSSIAKIDMETINRVGVASVDQMLEGQLAGVVSTATNGAPGSANSIKIRSTVTLNGNTEPLWVLDGMPMEQKDIPKDWTPRETMDNLQNVSIAGLNPDDIKDITVLKDAAATAIYGARAANGVIIVTTKRGAKGQAPRVSASLSTFVTTKPNLDKLNLMNASEKVDLELQLAANGRLTYGIGLGGVGRILDQSPAQRAAYLTGGFGALTPMAQNAINALRTDGTNFGDEIYRTAVNQQYNLSVSGGGDKATYYFSTGYFNEQGTTKGTGFERFTLTMKTDYDITKNLRFGASVFGTQTKNKSYLTDTDSFTNPSRYTRMVNPYLNAKDSKGDYIYDRDMLAAPGEEESLNFNYLEERENTRNELKNRSIKTIFDLDYTPINGLKLSTQFGAQFDNSASEQEGRANSYYVRKYEYDSRIIDKETGEKIPYLPKGGVIKNYNEDMFQYNWKTQGEYAKTFNNRHEMDIMAGLEMRGVKSTTINTKGFGYDHKTLTTVPINFPDNSSGNDKALQDKFRPYKKQFYENRYMSYFATGSYTYDSKYTFFGSIRYDGTNLFGVDPKYKFNPMWSVSGAWNANREEFLRNVDWLSNLRVRGSYGVQGNIDRSTSPYIVTSWGTTNIGGTSEDKLTADSSPNRNLRWETTYTWNGALDMGFFNNRLNATFEIYGRKSKDLITTRLLPTETGFQVASTNFGQISSQGIEFSISSVNITNKNFRWETQLNIAHNTDKVDKINNRRNEFTPSLEGHSSSAIFAIKTAGIDANGMPMFWKDGKKVSLMEFVGFKIEGSDPLGMGVLEYAPSMNTSAEAVRDMQTYIGDRNPKFTGGLSNKFFYKNFDLAVSCNFVYKQLVTETPFYNPTETSPGQNYSRRMKDVWSPSNTSGIYPMIVGPYDPTGNPYMGESIWGDPVENAWSEADMTNYPRIMNYIMNGQSGGINFFSAFDTWAKEISYFRINSIRLGYTLPNKVVEKLRLASARISFEARNPFVFGTSYSGYFDPETYGNIYSQPLAKTFSVGLNISF